MNELGERRCSGFRPPARQAGETGEYGLGLLESDIGEIAAVARVPSEGRSPELARLVELGRRAARAIVGLPVSSARRRRP